MFASAGFKISILSSVCQSARRLGRFSSHASDAFRHKAATLAVAAAVTSLLAGCAQPWQGFTAGENVNQVVAKLGKPKETYTLRDGTRRLMWPTQPFGETTTAADVDPSGKVIVVQQVLTNELFYQAVMDNWTQQDVLAHFGKPVEKMYFPLMKRAVWSYRYMDAGVWYMMYNFAFDDAGVLKTTSKSPDPLHDPDHHFGMFN